MIRAIILAIFEFIAGLVKSERKQIAKDGKTDDVKNAAASKLKKYKGTTALCLCLALLLSGCYKTVYVEAGDAVRLRESVKDVKVWVKVGEAWEASEMTVPEGWYCIYLTDDEINNAEIK